MILCARWRPSLLLPALMFPALLAAQQGDTAAKKTARLFRATDPVVMWLSADFKAVFKERDSTSTKQFPASLRYLGEKSDTVSLDVRLSTRGHYRLKPNTCSVPPLKVWFDKEKTKGTLFAGHGSLKLTTHCQKGERYAQNLYVEYAAYGMYNVLTPLSLKARLATINWQDINDPGFAITRPGFWVEDDDDMAGRNRGKILKQTGGHAEEMEPRQMAITDLFQYMIGNTDFSLMMLHNYRIVQTDTSMNFYPMAYDFDWSGLVSAPYARPDYRLPIKRVTDRLYRGGCHSGELLAETVGLYKAKREEIYGVLRGIKDLTPSRLKEATEFLDEFFKLIDDAGAVRREFRRVCNT
jgi:hypothetical protein